MKRGKLESSRKRIPQIKVGDSMRIRLCVFILLVFFSIFDGAHGADIAVGSRVYVKADAEATIDGKNVDINAIPFPAIVDKVEGKWLLLGDVKILKSHVFDADEAIADLTEAIKDDSTYSYYYFLRARVWAGEGNHANAVDDYTSALKLDPTDAVALFNRGGQYANLKEYENAIKDYSESIRLDPTEVRAYYIRGGVFTLMRQHKRAADDFYKAVQLAPNDPIANMILAWFRATCADERYRNGAEAVASATKSAELTKWKDDHCLDALAAAYAEAGDFSKAIKWEKEAIGLSTGKTQKARYHARLESYESEKPFHGEFDEK